MSKILWIDDDYEAIKGLMRPLEQAGHEIDPARTIVSALEKLRGGIEYELAIIDIILPLSTSTHTSVPACIQESLDTGHHAGEGLIAYMRQELGWRIPIIVMSVLAHDGQVRARLESYEISEFLTKGDLSSQQVKQTVERVLSDFDFERAVILNLRSRHFAERKVGLAHAAQMQPTLKLYQALLDLVSTESDPELRELAASILRGYPADWGQEAILSSGRKTPGAEDLLTQRGVVAPDTEIPGQLSEADSVQTEADYRSLIASRQQATRVLLLVLGVLGIAAVVILLSWLARSFTPVIILVAVALAAVVVLGAMGILRPDQVTELLRGMLDYPSRLLPSRITGKKDETSDEDKHSPT